MRKPIGLCLLLLFAASSAFPNCATPFPKPTIKYLGATEDTPGFINIWFGVVNYAQYDNSLFVASPDLLPCGANKNASRTWLEVYTNTGSRIQGFCAISKNTGMQKLGFGWKKTTPVPKGIFIRLLDRKCERRVQSNTLFGL
jgi:hypothetical protein